MLITSKDNQTIKDIKKLKLKKYRKDKFIIEGMTMINEAISENVEIDIVVISEKFINSKDFNKTQFISSNNEYKVGSIQYFKANNKTIKTIEVTDSIFEGLTEVENSQGILAVMKKKPIDLINKNENFILALDSLQDPGNLGTIIRTLDSAGINQIIISSGTVDPYSSKVIRSTMGAIFRVNIIEVCSLKETLQNLKQEGFEILATSLEESTSIYNIKYNKKVVVIGNEANGVSEEVLNIADNKIKIPMLGRAESLNASVAAGIIIYEYVRQNL